MNNSSSLLNSLSGLTKGLYRVETVDSMMAFLQGEIEKQFGFDLVWLYAFHNNEKSALKLISVVGKDQTKIEKEYPAIDIIHDQMLANVFSNENAIYIEDARIDPTTNKEIVNELGNRTIINCQLFIGGESLGAFGTGSFSEQGVRSFSSDEIAYFEAISSAVSITLDRINHRQLSYTDPLTKFENKRGLKNSSEILLSLAKRNNTNLAIIYIDLNNFKQLNDNLGHAFGDAALKSFASHFLICIVNRSGLYLIQT